MEKVVVDQQYLLQMLTVVMENGENKTFEEVNEIIQYLVSQLKPMLK